MIIRFVCNYFPRGYIFGLSFYIKAPGYSIPWLPPPPPWEILPLPPWEILSLPPFDTVFYYAWRGRGRVPYKSLGTIPSSEGFTHKTSPQYNLTRYSLTGVVFILSLLQTYVNLEIYDGKNYVNFDMMMDKEWWKLFNLFHLILEGRGSINDIYLIYDLTS